MCFPVVLSGSLDKFSHSTLISGLLDCELFEQKRVFVGILLFLQKLECSEQSLISDTNGWEDVFGQVLRCPWQIVVHEVEVCLVADVAICDHVVESDPQWFYRVFLVISLSYAGSTSLRSVYNRLIKLKFPTVMTAGDLLAYRSS